MAINNGEDGLSVRNKLNESLTKTDALDQGVATTDSPTFDGLTTTNGIELGDSSAIFGPLGELSVYHDGFSSNIEDVSSNGLKLKTNSSINLSDPTTFFPMAEFNSGGSVDLFHNGQPRLSTSPVGIDVAGSVTADGLFAFGEILLDGNHPVGGDNVALGQSAAASLDPAASNNTAVGDFALNATTTAGYNTAVGWSTLRNSTTSHSTALGNGSLTTSTTGTNNTGLGSGTLYYNTTGSDNVASGYTAMFDNTTGSKNVAIGTEAMANSTTHNENVAIGYQAMFGSDIGDYNVAVGAFSQVNGNTLSRSNVSVGRATLYNNTSGNNNAALGSFALLGNTTGRDNTAVGTDALSNNTTGNNNTGIGDYARGSSASVSNQITLGNNSITTLRCNVTTITSLSDARDKTDVQPLKAGLSFVEALNPVSFTWDMRDGGKVGDADTGFLAQDLKQVQEDLGVHIPYLVFEDNPDKLEAGYGKLIPVLVQAIKDLSAEVEDLKTRMEAN